MAQPGRASTAGVEMKSLVFFNDDGGRRAATTSEGAGCAREREEVYVVLHEEGIRRTRVQRKGWTRQSCIVVTLLFVLVCVVASVVAVAMYISDQAGGTSYFAGESGTFYCAGGLSDAECAAEASAAAARAATSSTQPRVAVVLGNGCFWERQYAYAMLEYTDSLFQRSLYNLTARAGYAGALGVGDDGRVCYHHLGGDQSDVYSTLGHAEGVRVWLDTATTATDTDTDTDGGGDNVTEAQFVLLAQDFLDSFSYVSSKGGNSRPDAGDRGAEYRSFLVLPGGMTSRFYKIVQDLNAAKAHPLDLVAGSASDGDDFNTVFIYDSDDGYAFYDAEQYHQFHSNFFGAAYPSWYLDLNEQYASAGLLVDTGCPAGSHWLRRQR